MLRIQYMYLSCDLNLTSNIAAGNMTICYGDDMTIISVLSDLRPQHLFSVISDKRRVCQIHACSGFGICDASFYRFQSLQTIVEGVFYVRRTP